MDKIAQMPPHYWAIIIVGTLIVVLFPLVRDAFGRGGRGGLLDSLLLGLVEARGLVPVLMSRWAPELGAGGEHSPVEWGEQATNVLPEQPANGSPAAEALDVTKVKIGLLADLTMAGLLTSESSPIEEAFDARRGTSPSFTVPRDLLRAELAARGFKGYKPAVLKTSAPTPAAITRQPLKVGGDRGGYALDRETGERLDPDLVAEPAP